MVLLNDFLEEADSLQIAVRHPRGTTARWLTPEGESTILQTFTAGTAEITLTLPEIAIRGIAAIALDD